MSNLIENAGIMSLAIEVIGNDAESPKCPAIFRRAKRAANPCEPVPVRMDELLRGVAGTEDEKVHDEGRDASGGMLTRSVPNPQSTGKSSVEAMVTPVLTAFKQEPGEGARSRWSLPEHNADEMLATMLKIFS